MFKHLGKQITALAALSLMIAPVWANPDIPVPASKPETKKPDPGFLNFTATLLNLEKAPNPQETSPQEQTETATAEIPRPTKKPNRPIVAKSQTMPVPQTITPKNTPLTATDAALYAEIFTLQSNGNIPAANEKIKSLKDLRLYGHVLHQRYMLPTGYTSTYRELQSWLNHYADHPGARAIHTLAERKKPANASGSLKYPQTKIHLSRRAEPTMVLASSYKSTRSRTAEEQTAIKTLNTDIQNHLRNDQPTAALERLNADQSLDPIEHDILRARIAASYLYNGKTTAAHRLAAESAKRSGLHVPLAGWIGGLSAWMKEDFTAAARHFEIVGRSNYASGWTKAAGSYWAARSHMRRGDVKAVSAWLTRAAKYPRTFYGLIATRALGHDFDFNWQIPAFTDAHEKALAQSPQGFRALALVKAGQGPRAEAELIRMDLSNETQRKAVLSYAHHANLPRLSMRLGSAYQTAETGRYYDAALYPKGPWKIEENHGIDASLIHAIMRQESRFNPTAKSPSGAIGLMQIIPSTARAIGGEKAKNMQDPDTNLEIGQMYLAHLLKDRAVKNELFNVLIAYNAGPGNLSKWQRRWPNIKDPLVFVELIPSAETRAYVERVLANYWIYRLREGAPTPTLNAVTSGKTAKYAEGDHLQTALAE